MTPEDRSRVIAAGYLPCALDPSGTRLLSPDGNRLVTVAQALVELGLDCKEEGDE